MNHAAFLDAIASEPDDLAHRLVYADYLEEHGDPDRAEFIRLQIEREGLHPAEPRRRQCLAREAELLARHETAWSAEVRPWVKRWRFRRGFVEEVTLDAEALLAHGERLFRLAPLTRLRLRGLMHVPELLRGRPKGAQRLGMLLARARGLDFSRDFLSEPVGQLLLSLPVVPQPEELNLESNTLSPAAVSVLADSPVLTRVRRLRFNSTVDPAVAVATLLASDHLEQLDDLCLAGNRQGDAVVAILLGSGRLARLRSLSLSHMNLTAQGLETLLGSPAVADLRCLDLGFNPLGAGAVRRLAASPHLKALDCLSLSGARVGDAGVKALTYAPLLGRLRGIDLSLNEVTTAAGVLLSGYEYPCRLGTLDLIYNSQLRELARRLLEARFGREVCLFER